MHLTPLGDSAVVIELGTVIRPSTLARVRALAENLTTHPPSGMIETVAAFTTVTVFYDLAGITSYEEFCTELRLRVKNLKLTKRAKGHEVTIPVCYGGDYGPDLAEVAQRAKLTVAAVIALHSKTLYIVGAMGFSPGFPYLAGLPAKLHTPRRASPRTKVAAGSVGIGGAQTGVYPVDSPGGWNLIGRTPLALFRPKELVPTRLHVGDFVKFKPISAEEMASWK